MEEKDNVIRLSGSEVLFTHDPKEGWLIEAGTAFVRIAKWDESGHSKDSMLTLMEAGEGDVIPALSWVGTNHENWRFAIIAKNGELTLRHDTKLNTRFLRKKFILAQGVSEDDYAADGFEGSLAQIYKGREAQEAGVIRHGAKEEVDIRERQGRIIAGAISGGDEPIVADGSALYETVVFACSKLGVTVAPWDRVVASSGGDVSLPEISRISGFLNRPVVLDSDWYTCDCGMLISSIDGDPVACIPTAGGRYRIYNSADKSYKKLDKAVAETISPQAYVISRTLPDEKLTSKNLIAYVMKSVQTSDVVRIVLLSLVCTLIGFLLPMLNQKIYDDYIPMSDQSSVIQISAVIASIMLGNVFFTLVKNLYNFRVASRAGYQLQDAIYHRVFRLEEGFLRKFDSADMAQRLAEFGQTANSLISKVLEAGITAVWSLIYLFQMIHYSSKLTLPGVLMVPVYAALVYGLSTLTMKYRQKIADLNGASVGKLYQFLDGVSKIRMAGAEQRAILEYTVPTAESQQASIRSNRISDFCDIIRDAAPTIFSMIFYFLVVHKNMDTTSGNYMAFNTAFGSFSGAMIALVQEFLAYREMKPRLDRLKPIMDAEVESSDGKDVIEELKGGVELRNVTFSYVPGGRTILHNVSFTIQPGEYVGIVGPSGCGKSTIMKLLLGFEKPDSGQVLYDGKDVSTMDKHSLRKKLGTALQNGKLISGSIFENITITASKPNIDRVNEVVEAVGLKRDIDSMPMGIHTVVSESGNTVSGGQQQRILIARAIYNKPAVLLFDEATSALDNVTQSKVCESLERMNVTRIVIAHRLSTIQACDRILVMENGKLIDEGNYETLMAHDGLFRRMAIRQLAEGGE